jgi:hypothetical protein
MRRLSAPCQEKNEHAHNKQLHQGAARAISKGDIMR